MNERCGIKAISLSKLSDIRQTFFKQYVTKRAGDNFARCGKCDSLQAIISTHVRGTAAHTGFSKQLQKHLAQQEAARNAYRCMRSISVLHPHKVLSVIHDKMDHGKTTSPCFAYKNKDTDMFTKLPLSVTGMIAHGHGDERYAHYSLDLYPGDCNHTVGSFARLLRDLEAPPFSSTRSLFEGAGRSPLYRAILNGKETCIEGMREMHADLVPAIPLPPVLYVQLDNCWKDNKCRFVKAFWSMLVAKGIFREVYVSYLLVGHTHDDIDASFGRWSMDLRENDYPTIPLLMKSYMQMEKVPTIPHMIEELPAWKSFVEPFLPSGNDILFGHTKAQQFKFFVRDDGWPVMQYKLICSDAEWLPEKGILMWKENIRGGPSMPEDEPAPAQPRAMGKIDDVINGLQGYIDHWQSNSNHDSVGGYSRVHGPLIAYWTGVKEALSAPLSDLWTEGSRLQEGFWPKSRVAPSSDTPFLDTGELREDHGIDAHYVGPRNQRPPPSFRPANDVFTGHFMILRPQEQDIARPIWLCRALTPPNLGTTGAHARQIQVEWFSPTSTAKNVLEKYSGWDTKTDFKWKRDLKYSTPDWQPLDCILAAWPPGPRDRGKSPKITIPSNQVQYAKDNLRRCQLAEGRIGNTSNALPTTSRGHIRAS